MIFRKNHIIGKYENIKIVDLEFDIVAIIIEI